jgi:flap endonuclease-1
MDSKKRITSHLSGLFYRNINLLVEGIKPIYVFDGKPPSLKLKEIDERKKAKELAAQYYEKAKEEGNESDMKKFSSQTVKITDEIIEESKKLLEAMGIPVIQASGEGEAEAALMALEGMSWASASQDYDSLLYGTPKLIRNLTLARKRKTSSGAMVDTTMDLIDFEDVLNKLQINQDQLICLAILVGTDYNPGGVKGIGQKRALEIVQKHEYPVKIFDFIKASEKYEMVFDWQEIFKQFKELKVETIKTPEFKKPNKELIKQILVHDHEFTAERIDNALDKLKVLEEEKKQKGLKDFF